VNGTFPVNFTENMIIRATQKNKISQPVSNRLVGYSLEKSGLSVFGQPRIAIGQRPALNHVLLR
jgi:hypothetical protein